MRWTMTQRTKKTNKYIRWIAFFITIIGTYILTGNNVNLQWVGWTVCSMSTLIWVYCAYVEDDTPRTLMELMYMILCLKGVISWYG